MKGDNIEYVPRWVWDKDATWTAADPLTVTPAEELPRSRDGLLIALAVLVIVALLAFAMGRAS